MAKIGQLTEGCINILTNQRIIKWLYKKQFFQNGRASPVLFTRFSATWEKEVSRTAYEIGADISKKTKRNKKVPSLSEPFVISSRPLVGRRIN